MKRTFRKYPSNYVSASSIGRNSDRFEFKVWDPDMYDDIMDEIDSTCESSHGELFNEYFFIEGPWEERYDVARILDDFGVDYKEV